MPLDGPLSVVELLEPLATEVPDRSALVATAGSFTYAELEAEINRATRALMELGIGPGDRIAASLRNDAPIVLAFLASQRLGAIWVGIPRPLAGPEKAYLLRDSGARAVLLEPELIEAVEAERGSLPELETVMDPAAWAELVADQSADRPDLAPVDRHAPAGISYTSGTTGFPKGAIHSQYNLLVPVLVSRQIGKPATTARQGVMLPMTSLNMMVLGPISALLGRDTMVCVDRSDAAGIAQRIADQSITSICVPPTIYYDFLTDPEIEPALLDTLTEPTSGGTQVPPDLVERYQATFGHRIAGGYGMTEAPTSVAWTDTDDTGWIPGGTGHPLPHLHITVVDENGTDLPTGEVGEITIAPTTDGEFAGVYTPMLGYWNKPDETAEVLREGRYHTGDLGYFTESGELVISGRRSDLIIRGGGNVYPAEIERVLKDHPAVLEASAFGVPDDRLGERVGSAVVLEGEATEGDLLEHCAKSLAAYKVPEFVLLLPRLPQNATGKVIKAELRALAAESAVQ